MTRLALLVSVVVLQHLGSLVLSLPTPLPTAAVVDDSSIATTLDDLNIAPAATTELVVEQTSTTPARDLPIRLEIQNYIREEREFEAFLEQLKEEREQRIALDRANYVADDTPIEEIMRLIEIQATTTEQSAIATESSLFAGDSTTARRSTAEATLTSTTTTQTTTTQNEKDLECPICLSSMRGTEVEILPCNHEFHADCFETWLFYQGVS